MSIPQNIIEWLKEPSNPSIRYRTLLELEDYSFTNSEVQNAYTEVLNWKPVLAIQKAMHPDGYWTVKVEKGKIVGDTTEYRTFNTTHWVLGYIAEYGLTRREEFIDQAANRYLNLQHEDGDFFQHLSCLYGLNLHTFAKLGFNEDPRIEKTIQLALTSIRGDYGYLCDMHKNKKRHGLPVKSCYRGSVKVLFGFSEFPRIWNYENVKKLIEYFLRRQILFTMKDPTVLVVKNADALVFPFTYREGIIDVLYPLVKMGYGNHPNMQQAWEFLEKKKNLENKFPLEWSPTNKYLKPGPLGESNKWITFYAYLLKKMRNMENYNVFNNVSSYY